MGKAMQDLMVCNDYMGIHPWHQAPKCFICFAFNPLQTCLDRVLNRGKSSGRTDDNPESFIKRYITSQSG